MTVLEQRLMESAATYFVKQNNKKIDWEQRRYEIAKEVLDAYWDGSLTDLRDPHPNISPDTLRVRAEAAVMFADALIAELKK